MSRTETCSVSRVGPLTIAIRSRDDVSRLVAEELEGREALPPTGTDLEITILENSRDLPQYVPTVYSAKELMNFDDRSFFVGYHRNYQYLLVNPFGEDHPVELFLIRKKTHPLVKAFVSAEQLKTTIMTYQLFWYVFQLALLKKGATFLHAGVFSDGAAATAITGTGGGGKTSCLFRILGETEHFKYLSEDFGVVDSHSTAFYNPKFVSIYHTDTRQPLLRSYVEKTMPLNQRIGWNRDVRLLRKNPRVKVSPRELLGDARIEGKAPLKKVVYLIRGNFDRMRLADISPRDLAERSLNVTFREMKHLSEVLRLINANGINSTTFPTLEEVIERTREIYLATFADVCTQVIHVPKSAGPESIAALILD